MKLHHFDGATMRPPLFGALGGNDLGYLASHCLVVETDAGDVALLDTGIGLKARADAVRHLGLMMAKGFGVDLEPENALASRLASIGRRPEEVRDIVMTHLDADHAGGLGDFPQAVVHVHRVELDAAQRPKGLQEKNRYRKVLWEHGPDWRPFATGGEQQWGLGAHEVLDGVLALELPGHTRGHTGYAFKQGDGWFVHAGDGFYDGATIRPGEDQSRFLRHFEKGAAVLGDRLAANHEKLSEIAAEPGVDVVCTHDPAPLQR